MRDGGCILSMECRARERENKRKVGFIEEKNINNNELMVDSFQE